MKDFVFISDFDGTMTKKDFYKIIVDDYLGDSGKKLLEDWRIKHLKDVDVLQKVFSSANRTEDELLDDILHIPIDEYAKELINEVKQSGGDFVVLSAGASYYIEKLLAHKGIDDVTIVSNKGIFKDKGIHLELDKNNEFYSDFWGIDKSKVVKKLKTEYKKVYYAGDSVPDVDASKLADVRFATGRLIGMLEEENVEFVKFDEFRDISDYLKNEGVLDG